MEGEGCPLCSTEQDEGGMEGTTALYAWRPRDPVLLAAHLGCLLTHP